MENTLRPQRLKDFIGQKKIIQTLTLFLEGVKKRGKPQEHLLLYGPAGIGKTTLAYVIAKELGGELKITSGPVLQKAADLAAILTNLKDNDVLFIDEIHRLPKTVEEILYPVLEDFSLDIVVGQGAAARIVRLPVPKITIIGATTRIALLSAPLRDRFGLILRLDYYQPSEMEEIIWRSSKILNVPLTKGAAQLISDRSRKIPRLANRI
jgi:Holliday junction DNA helicase subunit RuvB